MENSHKIKVNNYVYVSDVCNEVITSKILF